MAERIPPKPAGAPPAAQPAQAPARTPQPKPAGPGAAARGPRAGVTSPHARVLGPVEGRGQRERSEESGADARGGPRARVGAEDLDARELGGMSVLLAADHLALRMAQRRGQVPRAELIEEVCTLLLGTESADFVRKVLAALSEQQRVLDIYPLELLSRALERRPDLVDSHRFTPFVRNRRELESSVFRVEEPIRLELPLAAQLKSMALAGGGSPGYHLYPGPLTQYVLELGAPGTFTFLLRAEVRRESVIDRVTVTVEDDDTPDGA